eukprot:c12949_g1_i1.p1 GENE.c12949_g1_i1~~c12949_g1_i1.p1  ORF type:complete len:510 (-),score=162.36 c12949_g1_i1:44-1573(-)
MGSRRAKSIPVDSVAWDPRPKRLPENPTSHLPSWYNHDEVMVSMLESGVDFNAVCRAVLQQHATILSSSGAGTAGGEEKDADAETTTTSTSFSSTAPGVEKLTARMLQNRWYQFLYDPTADRQHLGNLCGGTTLTKRGGGVAWSDFEEHVLLNKRGQYKSFTELLHHHPTDFHPSRTPRSLEAHFAQLTEVISSLTAQQHQQQQNGATAGGPDNHNDNNSDNHNDNNAATSTATNTSIAAAAAKTPTLTPTTPTATTHTNGDEIAVKSPPAKRQRTSKAASSSSAAAVVVAHNQNQQQLSEPLSPLLMSALGPEDIAISASDDEQDIRTQRHAVIQAEAKRKTELETHGTDSGLSMMREEARRGMEVGDSAFNIEVPVSANQVYWWHDKYRPRKPRFFNRVNTGYEWNKYNQTHYDHDNPPPKTVQGYKFNIFFPDLIDPTKTPTFVIEEGDNPDTCVIRFHAGPPYEDIAFKIVNKEWQYSRKSGYKCTFQRGVLHLYFNFKRYRYRR